MFLMQVLLPYMSSTIAVKLNENLNGAACRNRTDYLMITNQLLYQMS